MKDLPLWSFFSLTMWCPLTTICFQMEAPAISHPHSDWRQDTHTSLGQYPIKAQAPLHLFCILLATKASFVSLFLPLLCVHLPPCCPRSRCKSPTKEVSSCIIIGSQAPIPKLSVQQHQDLEDRSQQSKISRKYYSHCANMINDMLRAVSKYWDVGSVPGAVVRLLR